MSPAADATPLVDHLAPRDVSDGTTDLALPDRVEVPLVTGRCVALDPWCRSSLTADGRMTGDVVLLESNVDRAFDGNRYVWASAATSSPSTRAPRRAITVAPRPSHPQRHTMPPSMPKTTKRKGPALVHTTLDALLDAHGTHRTEALAGRPAQAAQRALDQIADPARAHHDAFQAADTARLLARDGHADAARRIADAVRALPDPPWSPGDHITYWKAARAVYAAAVYAALGDARAAQEALDEALALAPAWSAPPSGPYAPTLHHADAAGRAALTLLDLKRVDDAAAILANLHAMSIREGIADAARRGDGERLEQLRVTARPGQQSLGEQVVGELLAHGHLTLFDAWMPEAIDSPYFDPIHRVRCTLVRAVADGPASFDAALAAALHELASLTPPDASAALQGLAEALDARRARATAGLDAPLDRLTEGLAREAARLGETRGFWRAIRALHEAGRDVTPWLDAAATVDARCVAATLLLPATKADAGAVRASLVAWTLAIDPTTVAGPPGALPRHALIALLRAGELEAGRAHAEAAATALRSHPQELGELAAAAMLAGDLPLAWELASHATKAKRDATLAHLRWRAAEQGEIDLYATVCEARAPAASERATELTALIERRRALRP